MESSPRLKGHLYVGLKLLPLVSRKSRLIIPSLTDILTFSEIFKGWKKNILSAVIENIFQSGIV